MSLQQFQQEIAKGDVVAQIRAGLIGDNLSIPTPFGMKNMIYADYTASGRAVRQVEEFIAEKLLPYYANSHTESSFCGAYVTNMRNEARQIIAGQTNASGEYSVIFSGSGATSAINRLVALCGIANAAKGDLRPVAFVGPYEHHSNILPWRESGAEVIEIGEAENGGVDLEDLERQLVAHQARPLRVGAFSAASNVTGIMTDVDAVTRLLKNYNALAFWDYAGGGPYMSINMNPGEGRDLDAAFLSPHKFLGGPGASGILIVKNAIVRSEKPTWPGGGSVSYVSPWAHDYFPSIIEREEAGTPNIIGDIRAALVFLVKAAIGQEFITKRDQDLCALATKCWRDNPNIRLFGEGKPNRLPIFSFAIRDGAGGYIHHQLFTRMLSDIMGIQARGGCVCAGPYGHLLLNVGREESERIRQAVLSGGEIEKPGWIRLNLSYIMDDETVDKIIEGVDVLAREPNAYTHHYRCNKTNAQFTYRSNSPELVAAV